MKSENSAARIKCTNDSSMHFSQSQSIHIADLKFIGCGGNQVTQVKEFLVTDTTFEGQENSGTALELIGTTAQIVNCTFVSNRKGSYRESVVILGDSENGFVGGAIIATDDTTVTISKSKFEDNRAYIGGAIFADNYSTINLTDNVSFINNSAENTGGVLYSNIGVVTINASCTFSNNKAWVGILYATTSTLTIEASEFRDNVGSVLYLIHSSVTIETSKFHNNVGFLLFSSNSNNMTITGSVFYRNRAIHLGGVLSLQNSTVTVGNCNFTDNSSPIGAVIYAEQNTKIQYHNHLLIDKNLGSALIYLYGSEFRGNDSRNFTFSNNNGSLVAVNSNVNFNGYTKFVNNQPNAFRKGGAITLFQSNVFIDGNCTLEHNQAENGGAIYSTESKLYVNGNVTIAHNTATGNGGGVFLESNSELNCHKNSTFILDSNTAVSKGGGLHAISSSIKAYVEYYYYPDYSIRYIGARMKIIKNKAKFGGGLSLEANAKFYILKYNTSYGEHANTTIFTGNSAEYGGAVYVDDDTNSGTCASDPRTECFFQ